ncbi:MAG: hypothetical protein EOM25_09360 [Deltaproteobacteria bacterium]|nr:hypothetical protein [Deltaproteobacteria bacterium]
MTGASEQFFLDWIHSVECSQLLMRCVGARKYNDLAEPDELSADLWVLLRERGGSCHAGLGLFLARKDWTGLERKIRSMLATMIAEGRRDPLYRRVRQVLASTVGEWMYSPGRDFSTYGGNGEAIPAYEELLARGVCPIHPLLEPQDIRTAKGILHLADSFRNQVSKFLGPGRAIPLRELCSFIRAGYPVHLVYEGHVPDESLDETEDENSFGPALELSRTDPVHSEEFLAELAGTVAVQLDRAGHFLLVCLLIHCELTMESIARALNLAGPSGVAYHKKKAFGLIRELTSMHEGLSQPDLDEALFARFVVFLLDGCNDEDCSRYA